MKVLALDQALKTTGMAFFEDGKFVKSDIMEIPPYKPMGERLAIMFKNIAEIYNDWNFDILVFEDIQMQYNVITFKHLAYVQSILMLWCFYNQIDYKVYSPSEWRNLLGGKFGRKREEQKATAIQKVKEAYDIEVSSDEADAICLGTAYFKDEDNKFDR